MENRLRRPLMSRRGALASGLALAAVRPALAQEQAPAPLPTTRFITSEDGRQVHVWTWSPVGPEKALVLFSHGAMSAPFKYDRLIGPWTKAGFKVIAPLHVDSTDYPEHAKYAGLDSWRARVLDMRAVSNLADSPTYVAAGHSYGAFVALTLGGAKATLPVGVSGPLRDPRAKAVVAFSPPGRPIPGLLPADGYEGLAVPALIETGDQDIPYGSKDGNWRVHLAAHEAAQPGDKYALILQGVNHYFGGLICEFDMPGPPRFEALATAAALSADFIGDFGAGDPAARERFNAAVGTHATFELTRK